jgi:pimeloyl-ACP methyl ester carboxylesterase
LNHLLPLLLIISLFTHAQDRIIGYVTSFDGVQITYSIHGNVPTLPAGNPVVVLVHGWSCDRTYWSEQTGALSKKYMVVAIDLAGHGGSGTGRSVYSMESFAQDVLGVVEKLDLQRIIFVGHSMGGDVVAQAALALEGRVKGLVLVDVYRKLGPGRTPEQVEAIVSRMRGNFRDSSKVFIKQMFPPTADPTLVETISKDMSSAQPRIALSTMQHALAFNRTPENLQTLKLPVIAINSDMSPTDMASMKKYGVEVMIMKGVGHFPMMEDPVQFNVVLGTAIQKMVK